MNAQTQSTVRAGESTGSPLASIPPSDRCSKGGRLGVLLPALALIATDWGDHAAVISHGQSALEACGEHCEFDDPTIS